MYLLICVRCIAKFSGDYEDADDRRFPVSPPAGVVGKSVLLERSTVGFDEETDALVSTLI